MIFTYSDHAKVKQTKHFQTKREPSKKHFPKPSAQDLISSSPQIHLDNIDFWPWSSLAITLFQSVRTPRTTWLKEKHLQYLDLSLDQEPQ